MKVQTYNFLSQIRLDVIKNKPLINERDIADLNELKSVYSSAENFDDKKISEINKYIKKPKKENFKPT